MAYNEIKELLDKYFEGETSLEEENRLRTYFTQENIPKALRPYQPLFQFFVAEREITLGKDFDRQLLEKIDAKTRPEPMIRRLNTWVVRVAALVALAVGLWMIYPETPKPEEVAAIDWSKYEPKTVEEAYAITRKALLRTSDELNRGAAMAAEEVGKVQKLGEVLN
jgi:hypothetical protein